ncbi:hypothetical protein ZQ65_24045 [Salmonella enterica subsp. enterica serovar Newport]|uniref:Uncharacterized protein n=1 Tax=Salmonella newport TaxID=108619 RepID=A0A5U9KY38_SALNE|nr:hypothetical protein [Salmonella enterica subsp. enterica serovar Newport]ECN8542765.1 hypothetical protein [Salmonella enterica subsp. enterica serovar Newport]EJH8885167.1 hypothetical protein [Salmonella enterica]
MRCCVKDLRRKSPGGADIGLDHYRRMSQASRKGKAFDDCFYYARQWVLGQTTKAERRAKKKPGRAGGVPPGLF